VYCKSLQASGLRSFGCPESINRKRTLKKTEISHSGTRISSFGLFRESESATDPTNTYKLKGIAP
jgi:hypothetical protein